MGKNFKQLLDEFHYHEALDRTSLIINMIDNHLITHPVFKAEKSFAKKVETAGMILTEAYQLMAKISYDLNDKKR